SVTLHDPAPGTYLLALDYWDAPAGDVATMPLHVWSVTDTDEGNMTVSPETAPATIGAPIDLTVAWDGLAAASRYLGNVNYLNGTDVVGKTVVQVDTKGVERIKGANRYGTAAAIAAEYPEGAEIGKHTLNSSHVKS